jgi:hypothetical protein
VQALSQVEATGDLQTPLTASALALAALMQGLRTSHQLQQATMALANTLVALTQRLVTTMKLQQTMTAHAPMKV